MPNLSRFDYFTRMGSIHRETEGRSGIMQSLPYYFNQGDEILDICGNFGIGYPIFDEGRQYSLRQFQNLKQLRLGIKLLIKEEHDFRAGCACGRCNGSDDYKMLGKWK